MLIQNEQGLGKIVTVPASNIPEIDTEHELDAELVEAIKRIDLDSFRFEYVPERIDYFKISASFVSFEAELVESQPEANRETGAQKIGKISGWQGVDWRRSEPDKGVEGLRYHVTVEIELGDRFYFRFGMVQPKAEKFVEALNEVLGSVGKALEFRKVAG